jgi:Icc-related predicted phosphoesterase
MMRRARKAARQRGLRIFFATDVHGSERCFRKFLAAAKVYEADVLLLGGDVAGKGLVPITTGNGSLHAEVQGEPVSLPVDQEERLKAEINRLGFYGVRMAQDEEISLRENPDQLDRLFRQEIAAQLQGWCELADERLAPEVRCIITPGNDDPLEVDQVLAAAAPRIECPERELCELGPVLLASLGDVTPTPWNTEREYSEAELEQRSSTSTARRTAAAWTRRRSWTRRSSP